MGSLRGIPVAVVVEHCTHLAKAVLWCRCVILGHLSVDLLALTTKTMEMEMFV